MYTDKKGDNKEKKVVSFSNPGVFSQATGLKSGDVIEVEYTPGDQYYNWAKITKQEAGEVETAKPRKVTESQYETRVERQLRQLHIVRQSCLAQAVASLTPGAKTPLLRQEVVDLAQFYVDWVYANGEDEPLTLSSDNQSISE